MIYVIPDNNCNISTRLYVLESGYFNNQEIVDSNGNVYWVKKVNFIKYDGCNASYLFYRSKRRIVVDFEYTDNVDKISLSDFKKRIIPMIKQMSNIWVESYD